MSHLINLIFCPNFRSKIFLDCEKFSGYSEVSDFSGFRRDVSKYRRARIQGVENRDPLPRYTSILFGNLFVLFIVVLLLYSVLCKFHDVCRYHISPKVSSYFAFGGPYLNAPIKPYKIIPSYQISQQVIHMQSRQLTLDFTQLFPPPPPIANEDCIQFSESDPYDRLADAFSLAL